MLEGRLLLGSRGVAGTIESDNINRVISGGIKGNAYLAVASFIVLLGRGDSFRDVGDVVSFILDLNV